MSNFERGSEWRRWDPHVHTPFSALNNGFGQDVDDYAKKLFTAAAQKNISAIGLTDYFCIDGYKHIRSLVQDAQRSIAVLGEDLAYKAKGLLLFPNIEFRSSVIVVNHESSSRVNFHVLFSDELDPEVIDHHFLRNLKFTAEANPNSSDERWSLTTRDLEELGKRLKEAHKKFRGHSDLYVGMMNAVFDHTEVSKVLHDQPSRFKDRFLIVVPADEDLSQCSWDGQAHLTRKVMIQKSHLLFSANPSTREFALGKKHENVAAYKKEFKTLKACIHGSDAHAYEQLFEPDKRRYLWVKADPTFNGLRQLLHEPDARVFVGEEPPSERRIRENATKYMSGVTFLRNANAAPDEQWFSGSVPINAGLVAIIGNKGNGKSALADILGLLGSTRASRHFSFLNQIRFLAPKTDLGSKFEAECTWRSGSLVASTLDAPVDETKPELVKYIPQNYLDEICSELRGSGETEFDREVMHVIFSHVPSEDRLGKDTLPSLIAHLTSEREAKIAFASKKVSRLNSEIVAVTAHTTPEYREGLRAQLNQRLLELQAHESAKPTLVPEPTQDDATRQASDLVSTELSKLGAEKLAVDSAIAAEKVELAAATRAVTAADRLLARLDNTKRQLDLIRDDSVDDVQALRVNYDDIIQLTINRNPVLLARRTAEERILQAKAALDTSAPNSFEAKRFSLERDIAAKRLELDEPIRRYQEYQQQIAIWESKRSDIEGAQDKPRSVVGLQAQIAALDELPTTIQRLRVQRSEAVAEIMTTKLELLSDYRRLYSAVQNFIDNHPVSREQKALHFVATISADGFASDFLDMLHQGRRGSFQGDEEGVARAQASTLRADFASVEGAQAFLADIEHQLGHDLGDPEQKKVRVVDQLRQGVTEDQLYDFLYGLSFLQPRFELRWQGKPIDQLSPGERGNLLLVFYLLIDRRDTPLIIDQPEENLDNQTVSTVLVPAIKYAKQRRQIVVVTHNPNLAVVCDADQIIHAQIDKSNGNRMRYTCGSIENETITQLIVDVLEGTKPAFDLRDARYEVLELAGLSV